MPYSMLNRSAVRAFIHLNDLRCSIKYLDILCKKLENEVTESVIRVKNDCSSSGHSRVAMRGSDL